MVLTNGTDSISTTAPVTSVFPCFGWRESKLLQPSPNYWLWGLGILVVVVLLGSGKKEKSQ